MPGQLVHRRLRGRVRIRLEGGHLNSVDGPDVDDPGRRLLGPGGFEQRDQELGQVEDTLHIEGQDLFEGGFVEVGQGGAPGGPGVIDQDVERVDP